VAGEAAGFVAFAVEEDVAGGGKDGEGFAVAVEDGGGVGGRGLAGAGDGGFVEHAASEAGLGQEVEFGVDDDSGEDERGEDGNESGERAVFVPHEDAGDEHGNGANDAEHAAGGDEFKREEHQADDEEGDDESHGWKIKNYELRIKKWPPAAAGLRASRAGGWSGVGGGGCGGCCECEMCGVWNAGCEMKTEFFGGRISRNLWAQRGAWGAMREDGEESRARARRKTQGGFELCLECALRRCMDFLFLHRQKIK